MFHRRIALTCVAIALALLPAASAHGANPPTADPPNIVFILTDDLATNLVDYMPNVQQLMKDGTTFNNYYVSNSLCCPSRSSIFTGKYPHNTGVFTNTFAEDKGHLDGGFGAFNLNEDQYHTFPLALQRAGYKTAMMGKYLNGYNPYDTDTPYRKPPCWPPGPACVGWGWDEWVVAGDGYPEFIYDLNHNNTKPFEHHGIDPDDYMTDVLKKHALGFIDAQAKSATPFFIEIATFAPHSPYRPAYRDETKFPDAKVPQTDAYCPEPKKLTDPPDWLKDVPECSAQLKAAMDDEFRLRAQSVQAVDQMIGEITAQLKSLKIDKNTYIVFSSDNGLHMGDYGLAPGKMTPFDIDINVPLVVVGPGVQKQVVTKIAQNVDLAPTFTDIAKVAGSADDPTEPDGHSLLPLLQGTTPPVWRTTALVEHHGPPDDPTDPDAEPKGPSRANPPNYEALRGDNFLYVEYYNYGVTVSEHGYYDLAAPGNSSELHNTFKDLTAAQQAALHNDLQKKVSCGQPNRPKCWP
jgi:arylsulfatase A-like enzyme